MPYIEAGGVNINFPFEPYTCQINYMESVVKCLRDSQHGILESPTGTGKTLCLLCSSLAWLEDKKAQISSHRWQLAQAEPGHVLNEAKNMLANQLDEAAGSWSGELAAPKVIYASRTHSQLTQAIQELKRTAYRHFKVCVLGSREQLCIHPQVMKEESNSAKVHLCRAKVSNRSCHFYNNVEMNKQNFTNQVMDVEDLVSAGQKHNCCPYYLAREMRADADIIFMPYNYLLDPKSRRAHGIELNNNIVIFDEAHNLERICEESASFDLRSADIAGALREVKELSEKLVEMIQHEDQSNDMTDDQGIMAADFNLQDVLQLKAMLHSLEEEVEKVPLTSQGITKPGNFIFEFFSKINLSFSTKGVVQDLIEKIVSHLTNEAASSVFHSKGAGLSKFGDVLKIVFSHDPPDLGALHQHQMSISKHYRVHIQQEEARKGKKGKGTWDTVAASSKPGRILSYWCFSPGHTMEDLTKHGVRNIILTSGTLSPMESFKTEMGINFQVELENPHVIEPHQVWIGTVGNGPDGTRLNSSYENRFRVEYLSSLGNAVVNYARVVPNGMLLFFPSYPVMEKCLQHWQENNIWTRVEQYKPIYVEPKNKMEFQTAMLNFYEKINDPTLNGAIFAAVTRGKVSEGLDFADNNGRAVVITGLPFPPRMDARVVLKMKFLDDMRIQTKKGLTGQLWYRQQASRAVNQAIGRVIRHKQDFGAIILCDNRFASRESVSQLPSWVRSTHKAYDKFGMALRDIMMFFKKIEQVMPAPQAKQSKKNSKSGCQGAYFEPTLARSAPRVMGNIERASTIPTHVPSLQHTGHGDMSLAKLKVEYEAGDIPSTSGFVRKPQSLFDALNTETRDPIDVLGVGKTSSSSTQQSFLFSKPLLSSTAAGVLSQDKTKRKKIIIKSADNKQDIKKKTLVSAEEYLTEVKQTLNKESYAYFSKTLASYKKTEDYITMVSCLAEIFTDSTQKYHLLKKFYRFVRPHHKAMFDKTCQELIGEGCGYNPEKELKKKRALESAAQGNSDEKKQKLTHDKASIPDGKLSSMNTKSTAKASSSCSALGQLGTGSHLNSKHGRLDNIFEVDLSKSTKDGSNHTGKDMKNAIRDIDGVSQKKSSGAISVDQKGTVDVNIPSNKTDGGATSTSTKPDSQHSDDLFDASPTTGDAAKEEHQVNAGDAMTARDENNPAMSNSHKADYPPILLKHPFGAESGVKCAECGEVATVPFQANCKHICCIQCWKVVIRDRKVCPTCNERVKRKHLSQIYFPMS